MGISINLMGPKEKFEQKPENLKVIQLKGTKVFSTFNKTMTFICIINSHQSLYFNILKKLVHVLVVP